MPSGHCSALQNMAALSKPVTRESQPRNAANNHETSNMWRLRETPAPILAPFASFAVRLYGMIVTALQEIEESVAHLAEPDLGKFRSWFEEFDGKVWDKQFEGDVKSGKLDSLADEALRDAATGRCTAL
jgi:hypothetical protein